MEKKIKDLKERFRNATKKEMAMIDKEIEALSLEHPEEFSKAMLKFLDESVADAGELAIREKLEEVLPIVSVSYLSKTYFKKTPQWFYHRLNGNIVNGKKASFSSGELKILATALDEIGNKLKKSAALI